MEILPSGRKRRERVKPGCGKSQTGGEAFRTTRKGE
jgi:hypothetical protein